jgi:DNA-binding CsgD family transcriptional regulator
MYGARYFILFFSFCAVHKRYVIIEVSTSFRILHIVDRMTMLARELLQVVGKASTAAGLEQILRTELLRFGIDQFELSRFRNRQVAGRSLSLLPMRYSKWKQQQYGGDVDPLTDFALDHCGPILWHDIIASGKSQLALIDYLSTVEALGVYNVISLKLYTGGNRCSLLHLSSSQRLMTPPDDSYLWVFSAIGYSVSARLCQIECPACETAGKAPQLTEREREVLIWSKEGKSYNEIAIIMDISSKTVEFHATNAMRKLNASQKLTAVLSAIRLGLIDL